MPTREMGGRLALPRCRIRGGRLTAITAADGRAAREGWGAPRPPLSLPANRPEATHTHAPPAVCGVVSSQAPLPPPPSQPGAPQGVEFESSAETGQPPGLSPSYLRPLQGAVLDVPSRVARASGSQATFPRCCRCLFPSRLWWGRQRSDRASAIYAIAPPHAQGRLESCQFPYNRHSKLQSKHLWQRRKKVCFFFRAAGRGAVSPPGLRFGSPFRPLASCLVSPRSERVGDSPFPLTWIGLPLSILHVTPSLGMLGLGAELAFLAVAGDPLWAQSLPFLSSVHRAFLHSPLFPAKPGSVKRVESERESMCSD